MIHQVVIFLSNGGARLLENPDRLEIYRERSDCLVDPDLHRVKGVDPMYWKRDGFNVLPMNGDDIKVMNEAKEGDEVKSVSNYILELEANVAKSADHCARLIGLVNQKKDELIAFHSSSQKSEQKHSDNYMQLLKSFNDFKQKTRIKLFIPWALIAIMGSLGGLYALHYR